MKKIYTLVFVLLVTLSNFTYGLAANLSILHFPKVSGTVCWDGLKYQTTYFVEAWDGHSTATGVKVLATAGDLIVYTDTVSIPITKTFYTDSVPDYMQVEAGLWDDGYSGGISGGGLGWSDNCLSSTAEIETPEPLRLDVATLDITPQILTKAGAEAFEKAYGVPSSYKSGCLFTVLKVKEGDFYEFKCSGVTPGTKISNCDWPQDEGISVTEEAQDDQNVVLSISFLKDFDSQDQFLFACGLVQEDSAKEAKAAAAANLFAIQREVPVVDMIYLLMIPMVRK